MLRSKRKKEITLDIITYVLLILGALIAVLPFLWMVSTSLKDSGAVFELPPKWIPEIIKWENYVTAFQEGNLIGGLFNTLCVIMPPLVVGMVSDCLCAYAFARMNFPGRDKFFAFILLTMMIPGVVLMVPVFLLFSGLGWVDTWKPLLIPGMFGQAGVIFFLRQYFKTIPMELEDAAKVDGANPLTTLVKIILPLSKPAITSQVVFTFIGGYNDYMGPLIYLNSPEKFTLQLQLASFQGNYYSDWSLIMAGSVIALVPTLILFIFAQKYFVEGITMTGLKG